MPLTTDAEIKALLEETRTIALVGASDRPTRPSYGVMATLQAHGYRVIPVNPQIIVPDYSLLQPIVLYTLHLQLMEYLFSS